LARQHTLPDGHIVELAPPSGSFWGQVTRATLPPPSSPPLLLPLPELLVPLPELLPELEVLLPELEVELPELVLLPLLLPELLVLPASLPLPLSLLQARTVVAPSDNNRRMPSLLIEEPPIGREKCLGRRALAAVRA
jgi:hypothetical protein